MTAPGLFLGRLQNLADFRVVLGDGESACQRSARSLCHPAMSRPPAAPTQAYRRARSRFVCLPTHVLRLLTALANLHTGRSIRKGEQVARRLPGSNTATGTAAGQWPTWQRSAKYGGRRQGVAFKNVARDRPTEREPRRHFEFGVTGCRRGLSPRAGQASRVALE